MNNCGGGVGSEQSERAGGKEGGTAGEAAKG